jgi:hypothetical protein
MSISGGELSIRAHRQEAWYGMGDLIGLGACIVDQVQIDHCQGAKTM